MDQYTISAYSKIVGLVMLHLLCALHVTCALAWKVSPSLGKSLDVDGDPSDGSDTDESHESELETDSDETPEAAAPGANQHNEWYHGEQPPMAAEHPYFTLQGKLGRYRGRLTFSSPLDQVL